MAPSLLVLAAGRGSRYGGLKQIDPVGPSGETVLDYAVFDAIRAGFTRVVFVIRRDFEVEFKATVTSKYAGRIEVGYVFQSLEDVPAGLAVAPGREKPWGTAHAVWCARSSLDGPFAVINADDFYGAGSFALLASFLGKAEGSRFAMVGFRLDRTLSENGTVSRGVCEEKDSALVSITEVLAIARTDVGPGCRFTGAEMVSMNCWAFTPKIFPELDSGLRAFLEQHGSHPKAEWYLPAAVSDMISRGSASVQVLQSGESWFGVTYREDKPAVAAAIGALVRAGAYPTRLFD